MSSVKRHAERRGCGLRSWVGVAALAFFAGACSPSVEEERGPARPQLELPEFELRAVVEDAQSNAEDAPAVEGFATSNREELEGLIQLTASTPSLLESARIDMMRWSPGVWGALRDIALDVERSDQVRAAAIDLFVTSEARASDELFALLSESDTAWVRARAAWRLSEEGPDHLVPGLVRRLRYETDHEVVIWLAMALARQDNLAGLDGLSAIAANAASPSRAGAEAQLRVLRERYGLATDSALRAAWELPAQERGFPAEPRSAQFRRAVWSWVARFEEFQLRGVDDARFVLERLDEEAASVLGEALHDEDVYTRVHSAQCLQRMGRRGLPAGPELLAAFAEPQLAPYAAMALGHVGPPQAEERLVACLEADSAPALRLACARALGYLQTLTPERARAVLAPWLAHESIELAQAASESLLRRDPNANDVALRLAEFLEDARVDPGSSERALRDWLANIQELEVLEAWEAAGGPAERPSTVEETRSRLKARRALVEGLARP